MMKRELMFAGCMAVMTVAAWKAGAAQARVADFSISVDAPVGELKVSCSKGCDWPGEAGTPAGSIVYRCASQPCRLMFDGRGRILLGQPLAGAER
jgi:hypothetical protein